MYSPVQDIDPLPVVYPGVIPYVPYGRILYRLPPTSIVRPASTHSGHPRSINSDPRSRISCDSARISVRDAIPLPPQAQRGPWRLIAGNSKYYVPNQIRVRLSACIPYCHIVGYQIETGVTQWCCPIVATRDGAERHYPKLNSKTKRLYEQIKDYTCVGCPLNTHSVLSCSRG